MFQPEHHVLGWVTVRDRWWDRRLSFAIPAGKYVLPSLGDQGLSRSRTEAPETGDPGQWPGTSAAGR